MKFQSFGHLYITNTSLPNKHNPVHFLDHLQKTGLLFFKPSSSACSFPHQAPCHLGEFVLLLPAHVLCLSRSQTSLEMKIFGQIVFYDRVGQGGHG